METDIRKIAALPFKEFCEIYVREKDFQEALGRPGRKGYRKGAVFRVEGILDDLNRRDGLYTYGIPTQWKEEEGWTSSEFGSFVSIDGNVQKVVEKLKRRCQTDVYLLIMGTAAPTLHSILKKWIDSEREAAKWKRAAEQQIDLTIFVSAWYMDQADNRFREDQRAAKQSRCSRKGAAEGSRKASTPNTAPAATTNTDFDLPQFLTDLPQSIMVQCPANDGKISSYTLSIISTIDHNVRVPQAVILVPSDDTAQRTLDVFQKAAKYTSIHAQVAACMLPGQTLRAQVVIGMPESVMKMINQNQLSVNDIQVMVVDNVDMQLLPPPAEHISSPPTSMKEFFNSPPKSFRRAGPLGLINILKKSP
ncbi:RNA helicase required for poly(A+) mRNA export [Rhizophlyctis rosea]|uniref:RNA helicase required for poly(A+) mRNA export n=1 Tax=Rhizophlyctis rosea TaxID=64517 RepID=A0AAD5X2E9_9FUNG|nr:RNA helicase required for poly(A+) mRNA export [Rhizophlyctis rosea]